MILRCLAAGGILLSSAWCVAQPRIQRANPNAAKVAQARLGDMPPIVRLMVRAAQTLRASGTRVVEFREGPERVRSREFILKDGRRMRTWFPNDSPRAGQVIIDTGRERRHFFPDRNEILVSPSQFEDVLGRLKRGPMRGLRFQVGGVESVANRAASRVDMLDPRGNVRQRLWIDQANGMLLRREFVDSVGAVEGSFEFVTVDYAPSIRPDDFNLKRAGARVVTIYDRAKELADELGFQPVVIPPTLAGYELRNVRTVPLPRGGRMLHQAYETEQGLVSLFQGPPRADLERLRRPQPNLSFVTWTSGGNTFALVGPKPQAELEQIARQLGRKT